MFSFRRVQCKDGCSDTVFLLSGNDQCIHLYKEVSLSLSLSLSLLSLLSLAVREKGIMSASLSVSVSLCVLI